MRRPRWTGLAGFKLRRRASTPTSRTSLGAGFLSTARNERINIELIYKGSKNPLWALGSGLWALGSLGSGGRKRSSVQFRRPSHRPSRTPTVREQHRQSQPPTAHFRAPAGPDNRRGAWFRSPSGRTAGTRARWLHGRPRASGSTSSVPATPRGRREAGVRPGARRSVRRAPQEEPWRRDLLDLVNPRSRRNGPS
jgi:hypothetical protein